MGADDDDVEDASITVELGEFVIKYIYEFIITLLHNYELCSTAFLQVLGHKIYSVGVFFFFLF